jgi:hydroxyacylglutathione hydrolase
VAAPNYTIEKIESAPFAQNSYLAWVEERDDVVVVDPGFEPETILRRLESLGRRLAMILNTHGHVDHIAGNAALKQSYPGAPLLIGRNEARLLADAHENLSGPFGIPVTSPPADRLVDHGETVESAGFVFEVREIPGHSRGSVVYYCKQFDPGFVFDGDVLFAGSIGRTDLGGNYAQLMSGIFAKLLDLPGSTVVYSGHGPVTTIGSELKSNPFLQDYADKAGRR